MSLLALDRVSQQMQRDLVILMKKCAELMIENDELRLLVNENMAEEAE